MRKILYKKKDISVKVGSYIKFVPSYGLQPKGIVTSISCYINSVKKDINECSLFELYNSGTISIGIDNRDFSFTSSSLRARAVQIITKEEYDQI